MSHGAIVQLRHLKSNYSSTEKAIYNPPVYPGHKTPYWVFSLENPVKRVWWHPLQQDMNPVHKVNQFNKIPRWKNMIQLVTKTRKIRPHFQDAWTQQRKKPVLSVQMKHNHYLLPCHQHLLSVKWGRGMSGLKLEPSPYFNYLANKGCPGH